MKLVPVACCVLIFGSLCPAQMTTDQKITDFTDLASLYNKNYGPYEWKKQAFSYDLTDIRSWLTRVSASKDDLEFYDICIEYVNSLTDAHDVYTLPSDFVATLGISVDIYDSKVRIDSISRYRLPYTQYPFEIGDELVSVDGKTAEESIQAYLKYSQSANPVSTRRSAAARIPSRSQSRMPYAHQIGDTATVVIRRQSGDVETYKLPWLKTGTPLTAAGPVGTLKTNAVKRAAVADEPDYMEPLRRLQTVKLPDNPNAILSFGSRAPVFSLPSNFVRRLGGAADDVFYSGTFTSGGYRIGFIRIPDFSSSTAGVEQFESEIAYFQANTDGLIVDDSRNPGGSVCYCETLLSYLIPAQFRTLGFEVRATRQWINDFSASLTSAQQGGASPDIIEQISTMLSQLQAAYATTRGKTAAMPLCSTSLMVDPATGSSGNVLAYSKPLMVLTDEFSASGGDAFPAVIQDNGRGPIFGMRTMGAGGSVVDWTTGSYAEGATRVTVSQMNRKLPVTTSDYPAAPYVENIGVRPDIAVDYMTLENLLNGGKTYVDAFTAAMVDLIQKSKQQQ
jgi:hypothetical protein